MYSWHHTPYIDLSRIHRTTSTVMYGLLVDKMFLIALMWMVTHSSSTYGRILLYKTLNITLSNKKSVQFDWKLVKKNKFIFRGLFLRHLVVRRRRMRVYALDFSSLSRIEINEAKVNHSFTFQKYENICTAHHLTFHYQTYFIF